MKTLIVAAFVLAVGAFAWFSLPTPPRPEGEVASGGHASHAGDPSALADGVVLAVDKSSNAVTISHGPLQNLGMPPMTMGFQVGDPALLERIEPGDKVRFHVDVIGGAFTVMSIEPVN
ncbi:MAG TPA: copper-binding protein [Burkholderiales bacterium]|nr:copper-binding protein [Burkholderiales bacterium]